MLPNLYHIKINYIILIKISLFKHVYFANYIPQIRVKQFDSNLKICFLLYIIIYNIYINFITYLFLSQAHSTTFSSKRFFFPTLIKLKETENYDIIKMEEKLKQKIYFITF